MLFTFSVYLREYNHSSSIEGRLCWMLQMCSGNEHCEGTGGLRQRPLQYRRSHRCLRSAGAVSTFLVELPREAYPSSTWLFRSRLFIREPAAHRVPISQAGSLPLAPPGMNFRWGGTDITFSNCRTSCLFSQCVY